MAVSTYQGLARKYRPRNFSEMVGQEAAARGIADAISENRIVHGHILSGPRGVGKTTSARILAKCLNCATGPTAKPCGECKHCVAITAGNDMDVIEFDAASNTKVEQMRDLLERVMLAPFAARNKVYIIDEVHMLSTGAFNALLKTLEEPPSQVYFIFATTEFEKIPETIRSRCAIHAFRRLGAEDIVRRLGEVTKAEGIESETPGAREVFSLVAQMAEGGMRDALVALDQILAISGGTLDPVTAQRVLGLSSHATLAKTVEALTAGDAPAILAIIEELVSRGLSLERFVKALLAFMHEIMLIQSGAQESMLTLTGEMLERMRLFAKEMPRVGVFNMIHQLFELEEKMKRSTQSRFLIEFTFLRMAVVKPVVPIDQLIARLHALPDGAPSPAPSAPAPQNAMASAPPPAASAPAAPPVATAAPVAAPAPAASVFAPEPPPAPRKPTPRPAPARQAAFNDSAPAPVAAAETAPAPSGPNPLAGLDTTEIATLIGSQISDSNSFIARYLKGVVGFRVEPSRLWIQWPPADNTSPRIMGKPENMKILAETLTMVCGRPMSVEHETSSAAPAPPAASTPPPRTGRTGPSLNDGWGDPEDSGFGMENPFLAAEYHPPAPTSTPAPSPSGSDLPRVDAEGVRALLAGNSELARRAKMVRDFFDGTFIDTAGTPLAI